jgi:hypothetical protein
MGPKWVQKAPFGAYLKFLVLKFFIYFFGASPRHSKLILFLVQKFLLLEKNSFFPTITFLTT